MSVMSWILAILIFSLIVIFHELGHFLLAKRGGIRVNEFSLGMGPVLLSRQIGETRYSLRLLPFGGSCMMEGEDGDYETEADSMDREALPQTGAAVKSAGETYGPGELPACSFGAKSVWTRISVVAHRRKHRLRRSRGDGRDGGLRGGGSRHAAGGPDRPHQ